MLKAQYNPTLKSLLLYSMKHKHKNKYKHDLSTFNIVNTVLRLSVLSCNNNYLRLSFHLRIISMSRLNTNLTKTNH